MEFSCSASSEVSIRDKSLTLKP